VTRRCGAKNCRWRGLAFHESSQGAARRSSRRAAV
jgi:hypothetical protein